MLLGGWCVHGVQDVQYTVHCPVMSVMMVCDRHHVEKSLHSYSEWLWLLMFTSKRDIDMLNDFNKGICSYIQLIQYFAPFMTGIGRHIAYSISLCSRNSSPYGSEVIRLLISAFPVSNWRRPAGAWQELIFLYAYLHLNRTLVRVKAKEAVRHRRFLWVTGAIHHPLSPHPFSTLHATQGAAWQSLLNMLGVGDGLLHASECKKKKNVSGVLRDCAITCELAKGALCWHNKTKKWTFSIKHHNWSHIIMSFFSLNCLHPAPSWLFGPKILTPTPMDNTFPSF